MNLNSQTYISHLIDQEIEAIRNIPLSNDFEAVTNRIHHHVHELGGKLIVSGMGKAGQIGHNMATTFSSTGTPAVYLHPGEAQHGDLGVIQTHDVLLLISNSGKTRELIELISLVKKLYHHVPILALAGQLESPLVQLADLVIWTGAPKEIDPLGLTPTTSTTVMTVVGDVLVVLMIKKIGFTKEDYALRHHGGYLGHQAKNITP